MDGTGDRAPTRRSDATPRLAGRAEPTAGSWLAGLVDDSGWEAVTPGLVLGVWPLEASAPVVVARGDAAPGVPSHAGSLLQVRCATKPVVAQAVVAALEGRGGGVDDPVATWWAGWPQGAPSPTVRDLLEHRAGLASPNLTEALVAPDAHRRRELEGVVAAWRPGVGPGYSEWAAGAVLAELLASLDGRPAAEALQTRLVADGIDGLVASVPAGSWPGLATGVGLYHVGGPGSWRPLPHDRVPSLAVGDPAMGLLASVTGLLGWYRHLACRLADPGEGSWALPSSAALERLGVGDPRYAYDEVLGRPVAFRGGLAGHLADDLRVPALGIGAVGHLGWTGSSWGWLDRHRRVCVAGLAFRLGDDDVTRWRTALLSTLLEEVDRGLAR